MKRSRKGRSSWPMLLGAALAAAPIVAGAADGYDAHLWQPVHDGSGVFTTWGAETIPYGDFMVGASVDYAKNPVVLSAGGAPIAPLIANATTMEVGGFYGLPMRFQAGVVVPLGLRGYPNPVGSDRQGGLAVGGLGDIRAEGKWNALVQKDFIPALAVAGGFSVPTGDETSWFGSGVVQPFIDVVGQERVGPVDLFANLGYRLHPDQARIWGQRVDDTINYRAGAAWDTGFQDLQVLGEFLGATTMGGGVNPAEAGLGLRRPILYGVTASVGGNVGLTDAMGTPAWRGFVALSWDSAGLRKPVVVRPIAVATPVPTPIATPRPVETPMKPVVALATPKPTPTPLPVVVLTPVPLATPSAKITVTEKRLEFAETIHFVKNSSRVDRDSYYILDGVAKALKDNPEILKVVIEGHTDSTGSSMWNAILSKARALSVRSYLVEQEIDGDRLDTAGVGEAKPIADNKTAPGRALNRRVEFRIKERKLE